MHVQTQGEWEEEISQKILNFIRDEIYLDLRYLETALFELAGKKEDGRMAFATDGAYLYYSPKQVMRVFQSNPKFLDRAYLHVVLHCVFSHLWIRAGRERRLWGLACDIMVEYTIDQMDKPCTRRILSYLRKEVYREIESDNQGISAAVFYRKLAKLYQKQPEKIKALSEEFYTDDHGRWPREEDAEKRKRAADCAKEKWDKIARQTAFAQKLRGQKADREADLLEAGLIAARSRRSYKDFLRKFSVYREEVRVNPEEFDLNYYTYGLRMYGNLPLIEPLESREERKIQEFVIAVDTSYSTSGELIGNFLRETFAILSERDSFFHRAQVRLIQCDNQVRRDSKIVGRGQLESWLRDFTPAGGGGTDFRPVFAYVNDLIAKGELQNLNGLLYFTDGKGSYPKRRPEYKTAFLFLSDYDEQAVPPWAMRIKLEPEEFIGEY